jgi:hypothetical protein
MTSELDSMPCVHCSTVFENNFFQLFEQLRTWPLPAPRSFAALVQSASLCDLCRYFLAIIQSDKHFYDTVLKSATWNHVFIQPSQVPFGQHVRTFINGPSKESWAYRIDISLEEDGITRIVQGAPTVLPLDTLSGESDVRSLFHARRVGSVLNLELPRRWLSICERCHISSCKPQSWEPVPDLAFRLIDVKRRCVVTVSTACKYAALSYVWGTVRQLLLTNVSYARLTTGGGLASTNPDILEVSLHAIELAEPIDFKYPWIYALCILQDDIEDKCIQMANMRSVYSCATLTIVSDTSNANTGLPGFRPYSRSISQLTHLGAPRQLANLLPSLPKCLANSPWESRGWTFQEKLLSRRLLIFSKRQVFYHCNAAMWCEDIVLESDNPEVTNELFNATLKKGVRGSNGGENDHVLIRKPSLMPVGTVGTPFRLYSSLIQEYTGRSLSEDSDVVNAFSGALDILSPYIGEHLWGLPGAVFHDALLWTESGQTYRADRRRSGFPSWAWSGWTRAHAIDNFGLRHPPDFAVQIYRLDDSGDLTLLECSKHQRRLYTAALSPKTETEASEEVRSFMTALSGTIWNPFEGPEMVDFLYTDDITPPKTHILRFWTTSAFLFVKHDYWGQLGHYDIIPFLESASLLDIQAPYEGERGPHDGGMGWITLDPDWRESQPKGLEFIILSNHTNFVASGPYQQPDAARLNAMLIKWESGIAYRVQMTVFLESDWIRAKPR